MRRSLSRSWVAAIAMAVLCAGCDGRTSATEQVKGTESPAPAEPEPELEIELLQYRLDQAVRRIQIAVTNRSAAPITVTAVDLEAPAYAPMPPTPKDSEIAPGARVDLPVVLGEARCEGDADSAGQAVVTARVRAEGGAERDVEVALPSPYEPLDRLLTRECAQLELARAMSVTFSPSWNPAPVDGHRTLLGALVVERRDSTEPLTVSGTAGNVIFTMHPLGEARSPLLVLAPGEDRGEIPIEISASRCDPHALADSKRTFFLPLWASVGDGEELSTFVSTDEPTRARLDELIQTGCGLRDR